MKMQRRTFLGGLLAAIAASATLSKTQVTVDTLAHAEQKIKQVFPEPEEGYTLLVQPGYGLPVMRATPNMTLELEQPPMLTIQGASWQPPGYKSMKVSIEVKGDDAATMQAWFQTLMDRMHKADSILNWPKKDDYAGVATFGPSGKDPLVKLEGLVPMQIDYQYEIDPKSGEQVLTAKAELQFDWVHQNVL